MATVDCHHDDSPMDPSSELGAYESLLSPCSPLSPSIAGKVLVYSVVHCRYSCVHVLLSFSGNKYCTCAETLWLVGKLY